MIHGDTPTPATPSAENCKEASDISWRRRPSVLERARFALTVGTSRGHQIYYIYMDK